MSGVWHAVPGEAGPEDLSALAEALAPYQTPAAVPLEDRWMTSREAADYLSMSLSVRCIGKRLRARFRATKLVLAASATSAAVSLIGGEPRRLT